MSDKMKKLKSLVSVFSCVLLTWIIFSDNLFARPKVPVPPAYQYQVLNVGVAPQVIKGMNEEGQMIGLDINQYQLFLLTPKDYNGDGFWDSVETLTIPLPDESWFTDRLGLSADLTVVDIWLNQAYIGRGGVVCCAIEVMIYDADGQYFSSVRRSFVVKTADLNGDGINDTPLVDLAGNVFEWGRGITVSYMNESGLIVVDFIDSDSSESEAWHQSIWITTASATSGSSIKTVMARTTCSNR
jgi:hypothetical protein